MKNRIIFAALAALLTLGGCAPKPINYDLGVIVILDGHPLAGAEVVVDGVSVGKTDVKGSFSGTLAQVPGKDIKLEVKKEDAKMHLATWEKVFKIKEREEEQPKEKLDFAADMQRFLILAVTSQGQPVAGAQVQVGKDEPLVTAEDGTVQVNFGRWPRHGLVLNAHKDGVGQNRTVYKGKSGDKVDMPLYTEAVVTVEAVQDLNGVVKPIRGASVTVGGKRVGKTGANGIYTYHQKNGLGGSTTVRISAPGNVPSVFSHKVRLGGPVTVRQFFYSAAPVKPRVAVFGFSANTKGEDISDVVKKVQPRFIEELFDEKVFRKVSTATARKLARKSKLNFGKLTRRGWRGTPLAEKVDVLVFGSISRGNEDNYIVEASFYESDGKLVMTQAAELSSTGSWRVGRTMSALVENAIANYPFSGVVTGISDSKVKINLGRDLFDLGSDDVFIVKSIKHDQEGRITGYLDGGTFVVSRRGDTHSELEPQSARKHLRVKLGDRVVRLNESATTLQDGADMVGFTVNGDGSEPLAGANLYIDERWVGSTNSKGRASVPLRLDHKYDLIVYHHGYAQASKTIRPEKKGASYQFSLKSFSSELTIESTPSKAAVYLDDERIGSTPMTKPYSVTLGFHTLRVDPGRGYRAWEEVVEFDKAEQDFTGSHSIVMYKDYLGAGERAESVGKIDEAIRQYSAAPQEHPDYAELHNRLGQLYLDEKHDVDRAIAEFERVQQIPEVRELIYKQYAIVYTNMGKAYFAKARKLVRKNRNEALTYFAKAVKALERARENTRFFPDERHEEAVHDTYYYRALAYQNLYQITGRESLRQNVENAWNEYVDFFPEKLRGNPAFDRMLESGQSAARQFAEK